MRVDLLQVSMMPQFQLAASFSLMGSKETKEIGAEAGGGTVLGKGSAPQGAEITSHLSLHPVVLCYPGPPRLETITPLSSPPS